MAKKQAKKRQGRPMIPASLRVSEQVMTRMTKAERRDLVKLAKINGVSISHQLRLLAIEATARLR